MTAPSSQVDAHAVPDGQLLTGHVAEWGELLSRLVEQTGLTVLVADPLSGSSGLLAAALETCAKACLLVDARICADTRDLAMAVADRAVAALVPDARAWWLGQAPPSSTAGLRMWRALHEKGIDVEQLRTGEGDPPILLRRALDLAAELVSSSAVLAVDHLGVMLSNLRERAALEILDALRSSRQRHDSLELVLVDQPHGPIVRALANRQHPLYRAGETLRVTRASPDRLIGDLAITRPLVRTPIGLLRAAADLASGVPSLTWQTVELAAGSGNVAARAVEGWQALRRANATAVRQQWDALRRLHPVAQSLVVAISLGFRPHSVPAASKTVDDGLNKLRDVGIAWQPRERVWAIADPLLAAFAREHPPPWAIRRDASSQIRATRGATD